MARCAGGVIGAVRGLQASSHAALPKPGTGNFVERFIRDLRSSGMEVSVGYPMLYGQKDCVYSYAVFHSCYGNNPASPYVIYDITKQWLAQPEIRPMHERELWAKLRRW